MKKTPLLAVGLMATAVLTGCATKADGERNDKLESFNRTMFDFNYKVMDRYVLEPAAKGKAFFRNLQIFSKVFF